MRRRLFVLFVPLALLAAGCSDDDPEVAEDTTTTSSSTTSTTDGATSTTAAPGEGGAPTSTTTPPGDGIAMSGDAGSGTVTYSLDPNRSELCYRIQVTGIGEATESHLHRQDGEQVLALQPPAADGTVNTCSATDALLIEEIDADPSRFAIDVHGSRGTLKATLE